ncbi:MAG: VTC domain-containing protein, partial [Dongiaceae bacterium]
MEHAPDTADARMTADRQETKYVVQPSAAPALVRDLSLRLPRHLFKGDQVTALPGSRQYVTTVYFDTASRHLYYDAVASESSLKLRAKEYYDLDPNFAELATHARQLVRPRPTLWLEFKHKDGARTGKRRLGIPKRDVPAFFG